MTVQVVVLVRVMVSVQVMFKFFWCCVAPHVRLGGLQSIVATSYRPVRKI